MWMKRTASAGLPMLNGFVGEFLILLGSYQRHAAWAGWALDGRRAICAGETRWRHRGATPAYPINS